jgi:hypothetical protein
MNEEQLKQILHDLVVDYAEPLVARIETMERLVSETIIKTGLDMHRQGKRNAAEKQYGEQWEPVHAGYLEVKDYPEAADFDLDNDMPEGYDLYDDVAHGNIDDEGIAAKIHKLQTKIDAIKAKHMPEQAEDAAIADAVEDVIEDAEPAAAPELQRDSNQDSITRMLFS